MAKSKIGKKEIKKLRNTITAAQFFDISENEVNDAIAKLTPKVKPAKRKSVKKK